MIYDTIIVGSGLAGLNSALKLKNKNILLLEKNNRLGGRVATQYFKNYKFEAGCARYNENHKNLRIIKGDIRDKNLLYKSIANHEILVHLACISNDPSFELNPKLGKSINLDSFRPIVEISTKQKIRRFIYMSLILVIQMHLNTLRHVLIAVG